MYENKYIIDIQSFKGILMKIRNSLEIICREEHLRFGIMKNPWQNLSLKHSNIKQNISNSEHVLSIHIQGWANWKKKSGLISSKNANSVLENCATNGFCVVIALNTLTHHYDDGD